MTDPEGKQDRIHRSNIQASYVRWTSPTTFTARIK